MKKLLIICLLLAATFVVKAQDMNFEETVKYINENIACCTKAKITPISFNIAGDIEYILKYDGRNIDKKFNFFDFVPVNTRDTTSGVSILNSNGISINQDWSSYSIHFQTENYLTPLAYFKVKTDAERVYRALLHLRSLCTKEATLDETLSFIKLKTLDKFVNYTNYIETTPSVTSCEPKYKWFFSNPTSIELKNKYLIFKNRCDMNGNGGNGELAMDLSLIQNIEVKGDFLVFSSTHSFFKVKFNYASIEPEKKFELKILLKEDAIRVNKAFKHLLKLLDIQLIDSKF